MVFILPKIQDSTQNISDEYSASYDSIFSKKFGDFLDELSSKKTFRGYSTGPLVLEINIPVEDSVFQKLYDRLIEWVGTIEPTKSENLE